eukprot:CAMPEP_0202949918 /NCGR_PEP_ID=MMETSP1395-20130829/16742_1 /ASSEMBLY_ACC=CAM_ASM_000871 /TAXON_ID=5961 /ORGANISM="Blepharisma japonicum, Strain Stock R1072" /LENGTH=161 /DNA_ID=CAMNT_0049653365 /DNA_START=89 /DNA_END=574 /DNA_ORIENTATION=+
MKKVGNFDTVWSFWQHWSNLPHADPTFLFVDESNMQKNFEGMSQSIEAIGIFEREIIPAWEDGVNKLGSDYSFKRPYNRDEIKNIWTRLAFALIGETFYLPDQITGIRVVDKGKSTKYEIWVRYDCKVVTENNVAFKARLQELLSEIDLSDWAESSHQNRV